MGSGNGKVISIAKKTFGVTKSLGYEIAPWPYLLSRLNGVKTVRKSIFEVDLSGVDVVYVYLLPSVLKKLSPVLKKAKLENTNLKIVSPVFEIPGLNILKEITCYQQTWKKDVSIFLY